jgi:hypothetical protein
MADSRSKTLLRVFGKDSPIIAPGEFPALIESRRNNFTPFGTPPSVHSPTDGFAAEFARRNVMLSTQSRAGYALDDFSG